MSAVLEARSLGKRYGSYWALRECSFTLEPGRVTALVGPNGAGKSTLLELAIGLLKPNEGVLEVMGASPIKEPLAVLPRVGFVAQEHPLYRSFSIEDMLRFGRELNPTWDAEFALSRIRQLGFPLDKNTGQLSLDFSAAVSRMQHPGG